MAPIESSQTPPSGRKPKTVTIEEEENWEELLTDPEVPTTSTAQPRSAGTPPIVTISATAAKQLAEINRAKGIPGPTHKLPGGSAWPPLMSGPSVSAPFPPSASHPYAMSPPYAVPPPPHSLPQDNFFPNLNSSRVQQLQNELIDIATVDLGLLNSVRVLEQHLIQSPQDVKPRQYSPFGMEWRGVALDNFNGPLSTNLSLDRSGASMAVHNMGHLIGLSRAIRLLREALEDPDRVDVTYELNLFKYPLVPATGPIMPPPPPPMPPSPLSSLKADDVKNIVKEVLKESATSEESQREMIKLVRDVCMSSLQRS